MVNACVLCPVSINSTSYKRSDTLASPVAISSTDLFPLIPLPIKEAIAIQDGVDENGREGFH